MSYEHPCGVLENLQTPEYTTVENPTPCIYNDLINKTYICQKRNECPTECQEIYHGLQLEIKGIEKGIETLEAIANKLKKIEKNK